MRRVIAIAFAVVFLGGVSIAAQTPVPQTPVPETQTKTPARKLNRPVTTPETAAAQSQATTADQKSAATAQRKPVGAITVRNSSIVLAQQQMTQGNYQRSATLSAAAMQQAAASGDNNTQAEAAIVYAQALRAQAALQPSPAAAAEALHAYDTAIAKGDERQRATALSEKALLLLNQGQASEALGALEQVKPAALPGSRAAALTYNLGRAYELSGPQYADRSFAQYSALLKQRPGFEPAMDGAFRVLFNSPRPRVQDAATLGAQLSASGQTDSALRYLRQATSKWAAEPDAQRLLAALIQAYAAARLDEPSFRAREWPFLTGIGHRNPRLQRAITDIAHAFDRLPSVFRSYDAWNMFEGWFHEPWQQHALGVLLESIADGNKQQRQYEQAVAHYCAAWFLDPGNAQPAVKAAALLREQRSLVDAQGGLFEQLLQGIFESKTMAYNRQDWPNILRLHTILGTIFEREKRWGPPSNPRSAIFQWEHAVQAERRVRAADPSSLPAATLYLKLGDAYREYGNRSSALERYLSAAEAYLQFSDPAAANDAVNRVRGLGLELSGEQNVRLRRLEERIRQAGPA